MPKRQDKTALRPWVSTPPPSPFNPTRSSKSRYEVGPALLGILAHCTPPNRLWHAHPTPPHPPPPPPPRRQNRNRNRARESSRYAAAPRTWTCRPFPASAPASAPAVNDAAGTGDGAPARPHFGSGLPGVRDPSPWQNDVDNATVEADATISASVSTSHDRYHLNAIRAGRPARRCWRSLLKSGLGCRDSDTRARSRARAASRLGRPRLAITAPARRTHHRRNPANTSLDARVASANGDGVQPSSSCRALLIRPRARDSQFPKSPTPGIRRTSNDALRDAMRYTAPNATCRRVDGDSEHAYIRIASPCLFQCAPPPRPRLGHAAWRSGRIVYCGHSVSPRPPFVFSRAGHGRSKEGGGARRTRTPASYISAGAFLDIL
ncbi:hypothetical protein B0H15DRAFT_944485 [Mycena belliarum]|uniref:Uncharacterized protein n=1 Tax=Mycena belliarum TaxID=1033014 RepID=A0AAD6XW31_9AGAR|nr:hypothetical protein B0H15DRAFT_944485 [Mycena belliae]